MTDNEYLGEIGVDGTSWLEKKIVRIRVIGRQVSYTTKRLHFRYVLSLTAVVFVLAALAVFVVIAHPSERRKEGERLVMHAHSKT